MKQKNFNHSGVMIAVAVVVVVYPTFTEKLKIDLILMRIKWIFSVVYKGCELAVDMHIMF